MKMLAKPVLCACLAAVMLPTMTFAQPIRDHQQDSQGKARAQKSGVSVRSIEKNVVPRYPGAQYLGFDYDAGDNIYTLKFLRDGKVIWVNVDGNTGTIKSSSD